MLSQHFSHDHFPEHGPTWTEQLQKPGFLGGGFSQQNLGKHGSKYYSDWCLPYILLCNKLRIHWPNLILRLKLLPAGSFFSFAWIIWCYDSSTQQCCNWMDDKLHECYGSVKSWSKRVVSGNKNTQFLGRLDKKIKGFFSPSRAEHLESVKDRRHSTLLVFTTKKVLIIIIIIIIIIIVMLLIVIIIIVVINNNNKTAIISITMMIMMIKLITIIITNDNDNNKII